MSAALDFTYLYAHPSKVEADHGLRLATCGADHAHPHFFEGSLRHPRLTGSMLVALTDVVRTHYFLPRPTLLDPVVTSNDAMLRFEGFSGCCGVYSRADLPAEALSADIHGRGTTNVDFNEPMRAALTKLRDSDDVGLGVGADAVTLERAGESVVEKKVKLPLRWLKGFCEVQAYQPRMQLFCEIDGSEARRFIRGLPFTNPPKRPLFVVSSGRGLRTTTREGKAALRLAGPHRLRSLGVLAGGARRLRVWFDAGAGTSAWQLEHDAGWFFVMLSPEVFRGFSGEGQALESLATSEWQSALPEVRAQLKWQNEIDLADVASTTGLTTDNVDAALLALGTRGLAGYDARTESLFHREMPFDLEQVESLQPRLIQARKLVDSGGVSNLAATADEHWTADVAGTDVTHLVTLRPDGDHCTCPWFSRYRGRRGPCKHILAARIVAEPDA